MSTKALLLAAGKGTRLKPLTDTIPKCLIEIDGKPLLQHWIDKLNEINVSEVIINTSWLSKLVEEFVSSKNWDGLNIICSYEETLLGTGGTLLKHIDWLNDSDKFLIIYADNFIDFSLKPLVDFHNSHFEKLTIASYKTNTPLEKGILEVDKYNRVISFEEKPLVPMSDLSAGGIYICDSNTFNVDNLIPLIKKGANIFDIGHDVFPKFTNSMKCFVIEEYINDIGDHRALESVNEYIKNKSNKNDSERLKKQAMDYLDKLHSALNNFPIHEFLKFIEILNKCDKKNTQIYVMGNGGSAATASHLIADLVKGCCGETHRYNATCLNDNIPIILAYANDEAYENIFIGQLKKRLKPNDIVIGISGSGNSANVVNAIKYANLCNCKTVGLVGFNGGKLKEYAQNVIHINVNDMQIVEDLHIIINHMMMKVMNHY